MSRQQSEGNYLNGSETAGYLQAKRMRLVPCLLLYPKINSNWITDLSVTSKTIELFKENIDKTFCACFIPLCLRYYTKTQKIKWPRDIAPEVLNWTSSKIKLDFIKIKAIERTVYRIRGFVYKLCT